jgi:hypothetical protein
MPEILKRNPMPRSVRAGRSAMWWQAAIMAVAAGLLVLLHHSARSLVPPAAEHDVYRGAVGLGAAAVILVIAVLLLPTQWRVLWVLILVSQVATLAGLVWLLATQGLYWPLCIALAIVPIVIIGTLTERFARRWFNH